MERYVWSRGSAGRRSGRVPAELRAPQGRRVIQWLARTLGPLPHLAQISHNLPGLYPAKQSCLIQILTRARLQSRLPNSVVGKQAPTRNGKGMTFPASGL